jgi:hypothetical protein
MSRDQTKTRPQSRQEPPRRPGKKEKLLVQAWHDASVVEALRAHTYPDGSTVDIPALIRRALDEALEKL